jgi:hypothetical protein
VPDLLYPYAMPGPQHRRVVAYCLCFLLSLSTPLLAAASVWKKIRYQGGTIDAIVNPFDWNTQLTASAKQVELNFAGRKTVTISVADITALSYGQRAYRRVADMAALSVVVTPIALFGILHKSKDHLIGIEFKTPAGQQGAVLLMVHKDNYRELVLTLQAMTGKPVDNWP